MITLQNCRMDENFIAVLADKLLSLSGTGKDLHRRCLVFEGRRPALFLMRELSRHYKGAFLPPAFFSVDELVDEICRRSGGGAPLSGMDAAFTIHGLVKDTAPEIMAGRESFGRFLSWADEIAAFIDHVDLEMIAPDRLRNVEANAAIGYDVPESVNLLLGRIGMIREAYHRRISGMGKLSRGMRYRLAAEKSSVQLFPEFDHIIFCNPFFMYRTEKEIVRGLGKTGDLTLMLQGDSAEWPVLDELVRSFGLEPAPLRPGRPGYELSLHSGYDQHTQVAQVREIVKGIVDRENAVLIVPQPEAVVPLLSELSAEISDINVSMGYPLRRSAMYGLLEAISRSQGTRRGTTYYVKDYLAALGHPLVKSLCLERDTALTRVLVHKIEDVLSGTIASALGGSLFIAAADLRSLDILFSSAIETLAAMDYAADRHDLIRVFDDLHAAVFCPWEKADTLRGFARAFSSLLNDLSEKSGIAAHRMNLKTTERMLALCERFTECIGADELLGHEEVFRVALDLCAAETVSFSGSPLKGFQILGMMESRALNFDTVVVMDMNESVVPRVRPSEPLVPRDVLLSLGLRRPACEEEIQRYQFRRLIAAARCVHLVYSSDQKRERSRFIEELVWERQKREKSMVVVPVNGPRIGVTAALPSTGRIKTPAMIAVLSAMTYSATRLNMYLSCPLQFYFRYVLGLKEREEVAESVDGADIGQFIHEQLQTAYTPFIGKRPDISPDFIGRALADIIRSFNSGFAQRMKADAFLVREVVEFRLRRFFEAESRRPVEEIIALEKKYTGTLPTIAGVFRLEARVDRIDRMEGGDFLILDYKTGGILPPSPRLAALENMPLERRAIRDLLGSFQLPLYIFMAQQQGMEGRIDAALYDLRSSEVKSFFKVKETDDSSREGRMGRCFEAMEHVLAEIVNPAVPFVADTDDARLCARCPYRNMCS